MREAAAAQKLVVSRENRRIKNLRKPPLVFRDNGTLTAAVSKLLLSSSSTIVCFN